MELYGNVDSKFRFIILASKRAKQLLKGAKPKIETKSRNPVRIAQAEIMANLVEYEIIPLKAEETPEPVDTVLGEEGLLEEASEAETDEADRADGAVFGDSDDEEDQPDNNDIEDPAAESEESDEDE